MQRKELFFLGGLWMAACGSTVSSPAVEPAVISDDQRVRLVAASDFACPLEEVAVTLGSLSGISGDSILYNAEGCGQRGVFRVNGASVEREDGSWYMPR